MKKPLNHSRYLGTSYRTDNYYYDIERSKATAKQVKYWQKLYYMFKDNNIDLDAEIEKRGLSQSIKNPTGRAGFSIAIDELIGILADLGLYEAKNNKRDNFIPSLNVMEDNGRRMRVWQSIEYKEVEDEDSSITGERKQEG